MIPGYFFLAISIMGIIDIMKEYALLSSTKRTSEDLSLMDSLSFVAILFVIGLVLLVTPIYKRYKMIRTLETESKSIQCKLKNKSHFLPGFLIDLLKQFTLGLMPIFSSFEFEFHLNGTKNMINKVAIDNGQLIQDEHYKIVINSKKPNEGYIIELLPYQISYYVIEE